MSYLRYLKIYFGVLLLGLVILAGTSFVVDPGSVYFNPLVTNYKIESYVDLIKSSSYGVVKDSWNERQVKAQFAKSLNNIDCVVIGSSHVRSVSKVRDEESSMGQCQSLANLGVPGASFEDVLIYTYLVSRFSQEEKKIFIGVDPWVFGFNKDTRWKIHEHEYREALTYFNLAKSNGGSSVSGGAGLSVEQLKNLLNYEYFLVSVRELFEQGFADTLVKRWQMLDSLEVDQYLAPEVDFERGYSKKLFLSDGSFLYDQDYVEKSRFKSRKDGRYKIQGQGDIDAGAYKALLKVVVQLKDMGHEVSLLFTPYHHEVIEDPRSLSRAVMSQIASMIETHREKLPFKTYGSYNPDKLACKRDEFYDYMHPKTKCVNRAFEHSNIPII